MSNNQHKKLIPSEGGFIGVSELIGTGKLTIELNIAERKNTPAEVVGVIEQTNELCIRYFSPAIMGDAYIFLTPYRIIDKFEYVRVNNKPLL
ncbi:MAG: hypothetical protein AAB546_01170 [Patescibacteria group bacterium]